MHFFIYTLLAVCSLSSLSCMEPPGNPDQLPANTVDNPGFDLNARSAQYIDIRRAIHSHNTGPSHVAILLYESDYPNVQIITPSEVKELQQILDDKISLSHFLSEVVTYAPYAANGVVGASLLITGLVTNNTVAEVGGIVLSSFNVIAPLINRALDLKGWPHAQRMVKRKSHLSEIESLLKKYAADDSATAISAYSEDDRL